MKVSTEKELGKAIADERSEIEVVGDLKNKVIRIKGTGKVAWGIAFAALVVAITAAIATVGSGGSASFVSIPVKLIGGTAAVSILGFPTAKAALFIGVAAGSARYLSQLRGYKIKEKTSSSVILTKN